MQITLFTENHYRGGVDTFIITLLNNWPEVSDDFTIVCNEDHPGLQDIREKIRRPCKISAHRITTYTILAARTRGNKLLNTLRIWLSPLLRYLFLTYTVCKLRPLLCDGQTDRLLIVNGGYPGGDTCRAAGIAWGLYSGKPASIHNFHNLTNPPPTFARLQENAVDALLARHTKAFVTVSQAAAQSMSVRTAIPSEKVSYIYNGLDSCAESGAYPDLRGELGLAGETPLCLMLGTYQPRKGHKFLLQVFKLVVEQVPQAHFAICGHGSNKEVAAVEKMVEEAGLVGKVSLLGFRTDALKLLQQSDILLVGSQEFESFGLTCVEAMALRIPVVATRVGGLPEVVVDDDGGFVFERDDVEGFARQVSQLLLDKQLCAEQGKKGFERYMRLFTAQRMAADYARLLAV